MSSKLRSRWIDIAAGAFAALNVGAILLAPGGETIPYHVVWVSFTLLYGYRAWSLRSTWGVLALVMATTGVALGWALHDTDAGWDELAEVPLMAGMFVACMVHVERHQKAKREVQRLAEREYELVERERDLVRNVSHELRTPITIARGHAELLRDRSNGSTAEDACVIVSEMARLSELAARLLTLATARDPGFLRKERIDVESLVVDVARRWSATASRRWKVDAPFDVTVDADEEQLRVCLDALLENAVRYTDDDDGIAISARLEWPCVVIEVSDTGSGIPAEGIATVFDRFARAPGRRGGGTGLGLTIVKAIVEAHDGRVRIASVVDCGTTVSLVLPSPEPVASIAAPQARLAATFS